MESTLNALGMAPASTTNLSFAPNALTPTPIGEPGTPAPEPPAALPPAADDAGPSGTAARPSSQAAEVQAVSASGADQVDLNKHPSGIIPVLQNVVATVNLGCKLDLKNIALKARNAEYNPKRFAAVIMRIRDPKTTALIFASGKMVCTGAKSEEKSRLAARKYCKILQKLNYEANFKEFKIQNIVGSCDVKFPIRLEGLCYAHSFFASYEPELFPGLIYRMKQPKIVLLIFVSGKVVLTGAKHRDEIYQAFEQIYPVLQEFRKGMTEVAPEATEGAEESAKGKANAELEGANAPTAITPSPANLLLPS